jgi:hypothetical protein
VLTLGVLKIAPSSCLVSNFRLNIQPTDLMEMYKTFLWTQIIQFFQLIVEWVPIFLKSIGKVSEIKIKHPRLLLGVDVDPIRPIDILNARY